MHWVLKCGLSCLLSTVLSEQVEACTAFQLTSQDGALLYCRSMEYGFPLESNILVVPRNEKFQGTAPGEKPGLQWLSKYGFIGMNQIMDRTTVSDGMNEKGLIVSCLYLPGFAKYQTPLEAQFNKVLAPWEFVTFLLSSCASVEDVKMIVPTVILAAQSTPGMGDLILPLHFYACDAKGGNLVIEYVDGKRFVYDNPLGVLTNSPPFPWHIANLSNYVNLSPVNVSMMQIGNLKMKSCGEGSGFLGLPGDYTPASRFIRAAFFSQAATPVKTAKDAVNLGFHILNTFDIFKGAVQDMPRLENDQVVGLPPYQDNLETTQWTIVHDRTNLKTYFRNYGSLAVQMVDFKKIDFTTPGRLQISMAKDFAVEDVTGKAVGFATQTTPLP